MNHGGELRNIREEDGAEAYLDRTLAARVVPDAAGAIELIGTRGFMDTDGFSSPLIANERMSSCGDSSGVQEHSLTRCNDGCQTGPKGEIGISSSKLHAFGAMGVGGLTNTEFVVFDCGQTRE